jgi:hypothetical protein
MSSNKERIYRWITQADLERMLADAHGRGAEVMREAAATAVYGGPTWLAVADIARAIRALPLPEDKR